jgi:hypothetical protein
MRIMKLIRLCMECGERVNWSPRPKLQNNIPTTMPTYTKKKCPRCETYNSNTIFCPNENERIYQG